VGNIDGVLLPRPEILDNAFVLLPLFDIVPQYVHPVTNKSYKTLWQEYAQENQKLWRVDFKWQDDLISKKTL
jgi:2-amino-4-hydroxy-6-hydroxymethyldihydropteridine diphosphokinase